MTIIPPNNNSNSRGRIATDVSDFKSHLVGDTSKLGFRHNGDQIDISPGQTLNQKLGVIDAFIVSQATVGQGFITVPDGYDTYTNPATDVYFDKTVPSLDLLLTSSFFSSNDRLKNGGILVIKSGTYIVKNTIDIPPGTVIMGEGYGTKIINATDLDFSGTYPVFKVSSDPKPVFNIQNDNLNRGINDGAIAGDTNEFMFGRKTYISNLVISDNFLRPTQLSDTNYILPQNKSGSNPLIQQEEGSNLVLDSVYLMGRVSGSLPTVSAATRFAIKILFGTGAGSHLKINNCFIDGFSVPIDFTALGGSSDYLEITNNKIRAFGNLGGNSDGTTYPGSNCIVKTNTCNVIITDNQLFGNSISVSSICFIDSYSTQPYNTKKQAQSKVIISNNNIIIDKYNTATYDDVNIIFKYLVLNTVNEAGILARMYSLVFGNIFQDDPSNTSGFEIFLSGSSFPRLKLTDGASTLGDQGSTTNIEGEINNFVSHNNTSIYSNNGGVTITAYDFINHNASTGYIGSTAFSHISNESTTGNITNSANAGYIYNTANNNIDNIATIGDITNTAPSGNFIINSLSTKMSNGAYYLHNSIIALADYTILPDDYIILLNYNGTMNITLPNTSLSQNRVLIIKDIYGFPNTRNLILYDSLTEQLSTSMPNTSYGTVTLYCYDTKWHNI